MRKIVNTRCQVQALVTVAAVVLGCTVVTAEQVDPTKNLPDFEYTLLTGYVDGERAFIGIGGDIDGVVNPTLVASSGAVVQVIIANGDGGEHEFSVPGFGATTSRFAGPRSADVVAFRVTESGSFHYACTDHEHRKAGMEGLLVVYEPEEFPPKR